jgi:hypothetical protein
VPVFVARAIIAVVVYSLAESEAHTQRFLGRQLLIQRHAFVKALTLVIALQSIEV